MNKLFCFMIIFLLALSLMNIAYAEKVLVGKFTYDKGNLNLTDSIIKEGFSEQFDYAPASAFRIEMLTDQNRVLYKYRFRPPNVIFIDSSDQNGTLSGGVVVLNKTEFSLSLPYFEDAAKLRLFTNDTAKPQIIPIPKQEEKVSYLWIGIISAIIAIGLTMVALFYNKHKKK